jgi:magnesium-transporting ATPase (P-type)
MKERDMAETKENKEKEKSRRDALSKFLYNLAQTCFTAMVVGTIVTFFISDVPKLAFFELFAMGVISTLAFAYLGNYILRK